MSYDIAVWEGPPPDNDVRALEMYNALLQRYHHSNTAPTSRIRGFVSSLTDRYPDLTELPAAKVDDSPWVDAPLLLNASGPMFYFGLAFSKVDEVLPFISGTVHKHGLVGFDPQLGHMI